jgi:hypothetical protein
MSSEESTAEDQQGARDEPADTEARSPEETKSSGTLEGQIEEVKQRAREMAGGAEQPGGAEVGPRGERIAEREAVGREERVGGPGTAGPDEDLGGGGAGTEEAQAADRGLTGGEDS